MGGHESRELSDDEIESFSEATGLSKEKILDGWEKFNVWSESETEEYISLGTVKQILPLFSSDDHSILTKEVIIERIFQVFDTDKNGSIDFKEFLAAITIYKSDDPKALAKLVYKIGDKDNSDGIDRDEFEKLGSLYLDNSDKNEFEKSELKKNFGILIDSFFIQYDKEKKGYLTEEEFGVAFQCLKNDKSLGLSFR